MAEFQRMPTQEELQKILYMGQMQGKTTQEIINENLAKGGTVKPLPENFFTTASAGAKRAGEYINRAGTAADVAKLFPGYQPETKVTIPTSFSVVPKVDPYSGQVMPTGIQTQQASIGNVLQQIKPADVLGVSGAERAYGDIGAGKAPQPFDVIDTLGVGAAGMAGAKGLLGAAKATKNLPVGMSIQDVTNSGLLATAPKSEIGFYSAVENAAMASPRKSATGQAFLNDIMKGQDVRADEIKWMGLDDYLKDKKSITKQEVQDYIANNRVDVKEVQLGAGYAPIERELNNQGYELNVDMDGDWSIFKDNQYVDLDELPQDLQNFVINNAPSKTETKFGQYTLPGGENYREILLTMPSKNPEFDPSNLSRLTELSNKNRTEAENIEYKSLAKQYDASLRGETAEQYRSSHFDQPNILAHLRVNDRVDADGKKMLLIEEVQSDWHQAGREGGYATPESKKNFEKLLSEKESINYDLQAMTNKYDEYINNGEKVPDSLKEKNAELEKKYKEIQEKIKLNTGAEVPDAPFKDTWYQLALKRAIQHAAENGYERIGLTTGSQQAARFDLSKQVERIISSKDGDGFRIFARDTNGKNHDMGVFTKDGLSDVVGKDLAKKIASQNKATEVFEGVDLQVGGEGMKKYYDEIYPKFLDKYGKKWGAKVGETKIRTQSDKQAQEDLDLLEALGEDRSKFSGSGMARVRYIDITPEMKAGVSKGQPLFAAAPIGVTGGLLGTQQDQRK
jgi:hypothetical protein